MTQVLLEIEKVFLRNKQVQKEAVVAKWLRRLTRNQIPSGSVGSSPTDRVKEYIF